MGRVTAGLDEHFRTAAASLTPSGATAGDPDELARLFEAQALSRHLDFVARDLHARGVGYYTIGSAGHESNAAVAMALRPTDPALLHYRSGGFYCARAAQVSGVDPVRDVLLGLTASRDEPISGGRHKVFGNAALHVIPQTSTIASHLPRAVGLAFALAPRAADRRGDPLARGRGRGGQPRRRVDQPLDGGGGAQRRRPRRAHPDPVAVARGGRGQRVGHLGAQPPGLGRDRIVDAARLRVPEGRRHQPARRPGRGARGGRPRPRHPQARRAAPADRALPGPRRLRRRARLPPRARRDRRPPARPAARHGPGPGGRGLVERGRAGQVRSGPLPRPGDRRRRAACRVPGVGRGGRAAGRPAHPGRPHRRRRGPQGVLPPWPARGERTAHPRAVGQRRAGRPARRRVRRPWCSARTSAPRAACTASRSACRRPSAPRGSSTPPSTSRPSSDSPSAPRWPACCRSPRSSTSPTSTTPRTSCAARRRRWASSPTASTPTAWSCGSPRSPPSRASAGTSTTTTPSQCCATSPASWSPARPAPPRRPISCGRWPVSRSARAGSACCSSRRPSTTTRTWRRRTPPPSGGARSSTGATWAGCTGAAATCWS